MPNIITGIRILCALSLLFCPAFSIGFYVLYLIGGVSDVLDGIVARALGKETAFGARFDTVADVVFFTVVIVRTLRAVSFPTWVIVWTVCIALIKCFNVIMGFVLYKRFVSEHTVLNKICGVLLYAIPLYINLLPWQPIAVLLCLTCGMATVAAIEEAYKIRIGENID